MGDYNYATHNQIEGSTLHGGQHWSTTNNYHESVSQDSFDREQSHKILKPLVANLETSTFLGLLLPMTNQLNQVSKKWQIEPDDPKLYWILRDADFNVWESANSSQVLWLFGGPPGCAMSGVSSLIAKQEAARRDGAVFYCSCSMGDSDAITAFTHSVLRHILNGSNARQAKSIIETFLSTLLLKIIQRNRSRFKDGGSSVITIEEILKARGGGQLEALTEAVVEIRTIGDMPIIIEGIDTIGPDGARFLKSFCSRGTANSKPKVLVTCRPDPHMKEIVDGVPCIEYDKERQECLNSLRYHGTRYDKISTEHDGTLTWLWGHDQYREWSSSSHSDLILIEGKPGSGKSTVTKYFKDNLLKREQLAKQAIVASFFYSYRDGELHTNHDNMVRSILYDVLHQNETFFFHFQSHYRKTLLHGAWRYDSLKQVLLSFRTHPAEERLYLIVDAIDESDENRRDVIIRLLHELCATTGLCVVKVFLASRPIAWERHKTPQIKNIITMQDENGQDILKFTESFLGKFKLSPEFYNKLKDDIIQNAEGVFIWVRLVEEELLKYVRTGYSNDEIEQFLESLPKDLDGLYKRMLGKLEENEVRDIQLGIRIFRLILFAKRPLRIQEIHHAIAIPDTIDTEYSPSDESFKNALMNNIHRRIIHCGGNFLEIKEDIVQFTHQTAFTFFTQLDGPVARPGAFNMSKDDSLLRISITCIRYLMLCVARSTPEDEPPNTEFWDLAHYEQYVEYLNGRPFINYALSHLQTLHLQDHRDDCSLCVNVRRLVSQLCGQPANSPASLLFGTWIYSNLGRGIATEQKRLTAKGFKNKMRHTATTASKNFKSWIDSNVSRSVDAEEKRPPAKDFRNDMLHTATRMQYSRVVEALLTAGADKEACLFDKTPLLLSAETGDVATARVLLRKGARTNAKDDEERTSLLLAAMKGHDTMVSLLIDGGANKEEKDGHGQTALHHAALNGHDSTVLRLVKILGADKEAKEMNDWTALHLAVRNGQYAVAQLLVETLGADIEAKDRFGFTSLHLAAMQGHETTVKLLANFAANREAQDNAKRTPLHWAAIFSHQGIGQLLVNEIGANKEAEDGWKYTALHFAAVLGDESTVRLLVSTLHVNKETKNLEGKTALDIAREAHLNPYPYYSYIYYHPYNRYPYYRPYPYPYRREVDFDGLPKVIRFLESGE